MEDLETPRDDNSLLSRSNCNSFTTSPLKDNTLLINMNNDFIVSNQQSANFLRFII